MALKLGELVTILSADDSKLHKTLDRTHAKLAIVGKAAGFASLANSAISLGAAIAPVAGALLALPAAAAGAKVAMATLALALAGVGDVLSEAVAGDMEKFKEQLKKLPRNARKVVGELGMVFLGLRARVQQGFFAPMVKEAKGLAERLRGPLHHGMQDVARSLGGVGAEVLKFVKSGESVSFLKTLFAEVADGIDGAKSGVKPLLTGIRNLIAVFVPGFGSAGEAVGRLMTRVGGWLSRISRGGQALGWATTAKAKLEQLWDIITDVGAGLRDVFKASGASGDGVLESVAGLTQQFRDWAGTAEGQQKVADAFAFLAQVSSDLAVIMPGVLSVIGQIAAWIGSLPPGVQSVVSGFLAWSIVGGMVIGRLSGVFSAIGTVVGGIKSMTDYLATPDTKFRNFFSKVGEGFSAMGRGMKAGAGKVAEFGKAVGGHLATAGRNAGQWLGQIASKGASAASSFGTAAANMGRSALTAAGSVARATGTMIASMARAAAQTVLSAARVVGGWILMGIQSMINAIRMAAAWIISMGPIAWIIAAVIGLVALIIIFWDDIKAATVAVFTAVVDWIKGAFDWVMNIIHMVIDWVKSNWPLLLAILTGPFGLMVYFIIKFKDDIIAFIGDAVDWVVQKFNDIVDFVKSLPGKIAKVASGMWDGIKDAFRGAVNWLIDAWNNFELKIGGGTIFGVSIPEIVLGTPDIPRLKDGGHLLTGGAVMVGDGGQPEILHPPRGAVVENLEHAASRERIDGLERRIDDLRDGGGGVTIEGDAHFYGIDTGDPEGDFMRAVAWGAGA